ncbi:glycosyltransferase [Occultella gossypii]|uniref:D-inositol 3-phosphate glycosyltransferase n=1 Tax=Occultella gossypii TaxID=2800820 RepID=A0ABS7SDA7_9MICO|nr:glycosyltransferase [Occultella gossypii]MBZ2198331.1 glycosyltransferase [Occultella gossypii]
MRVALVTDYYLPTLGGVQTAVKALREGLERAGHEVVVCCPLAGPSEDPGIVGLPISGVFRPDGYPFAWSPARVRDVLRREFRRRGVQVVHTHSEMFAALGGFRVADELGLPVVHTMHGRIDVYTASVLPAPALSTPLLAWLHHRQLPHRGVRVAGTQPYTQTRTARRMWRLMAAQARASDHVVVPSAHFARKLTGVGVTTPITVVSNGVEPSVLERIGDAALRAPEPGAELRLLWVGRLSPEKRPEVFVEAMRTAGGGVRADVYGDGVARRAVSRAAAGLPVSLHGAVPQEEVFTAMRRSHLLVSSSVDFDNQPMVILEAIAAGLPVLHCDPDLAEVVPDGAGFCTPTPDAAGIVQVLDRLRAHPGEVTRASAAMLAARSSAAVPVRAIEQVYDAALRGAAEPAA